MAKKSKTPNLYDELNQPVAVANWYADYTGTPPTQPYDHEAGPTYNYFTTDTDGNPSYGLGYSVVLAAVNTADQVQVYVSWLDDIDGEGGLMWRGELIRNGAAVLEWAASQTGQMVDAAAFRVARSACAGFNFDGYIDARVSPWEWAKQNILPFLPLVLDIGPDGVRPIPWRPTVSDADVTLRLDADLDPRISRTSTIRSDITRIVNREIGRAHV